MELFYRRYLCFFAFLFVFASFIATVISEKIHIVAMVFALALAVCALLILIFFKKIRFAFIVVFVSFLFVLVSLINSFVFITLPTREAGEYVGKTEAVKLEIIEVVQISGTSSEYTVRIKQIDDKKSNIKAGLHCSFPSELDYGDVVMAVADISEPTYRNKGDKDKLLSLSVSDERPVLYKEETDTNYFSADGIKYVFGKARVSFGEYVNNLFGEEKGALIRGFLINDTSDISSAVKLDFRRSGTSHLLAVSGLHIAILIGLMEIFLKKALLPKRLRCIVVSIIAVLFLGLTNFSASAVRSVFMLLAVYISYMFSEDGDSVTALFVAIFLILLISPFSVYDLGMWLSFFATLGLLTLYPFLEGKLPKRKLQSKALTILLNFLLTIFKTVLLTVVANIFILPVVWYFFGEISLAAIPVNLLLSPIILIFLPLCAISVIFGFVPILNSALVFVTSSLAELILFINSTFADIKGAVLSLRYPFVTPLIIVFIIAFSLLMLIKLKQKLWVCVPPAVFCILFAVGLTVFNLTAKPQVRYMSSDENDYLFIDKANSSTVYDVSSGGYDSYAFIFANLNPYATEIENYILSHCHRGHVYSIEKALLNFSVRNLYLPLSRDKDELSIVADIYLIAKEYGVKTFFYESGEEIWIFDDISIKPCFESADKYSSVSASVEGDEMLFAYSDAFESDSALLAGARSPYFLLGVHGERFQSVDEEYIVSPDTKIIFATVGRSEHTKISGCENPYVIKPQDDQIKLILPLS